MPFHALIFYEAEDSAASGSGGGNGGDERVVEMILGVLAQFKGRFVLYILVCLIEIVLLMLVDCVHVCLQIGF